VRGACGRTRSTDIRCSVGSWRRTASRSSPPFFSLNDHGNRAILLDDAGTERSGEEGGGVAPLRRREVSACRDEDGIAAENARTSWRKASARYRTVEIGFAQRTEHGFPVFRATSRKPWTGELTHSRTRGEKISWI